MKRKTGSKILVDNRRKNKVAKESYGETRGGIRYNPDVEFEGMESPRPVKLTIPKNAFVDAKILEYKKEKYKDKDGNLKERIVHRTAHCKSVSELKECEVRRDTALEKMKETTGFDAGDPTETLLRAGPTEEFLPLLGGPFSKQLYLTDYLDMHRKAFEAWNHNPIAHQIVRLITFYTFGRGVKCVGSEKAKNAMEDFWTRNTMDTRLRTASDELSIYGEVIIRRFRERDTNNLLLRLIDPSTVWEIVTDPDDIETVYYYHQQYPTAFQLFTKPPVEVSRFIIRQIPAEDVIHIKINSVSNEKRGRSDLFSILGWLKRFKDWATDRVILNKVAAQILHVHTVKGSPDDVKAAANRFTTAPETGSTIFLNEAEKREIISSGVHAQDVKEDGVMLMNTIAVGAGVPKEYLGLGDVSTRATAFVASEPGVKKIQERQEIFKELLKKIAGWVMKDSELTGEDAKCDFVFPEVAVEDRTQKIKDLGLAQTFGWVSRKRASEIVAKELGIDDYDFEAEMGQIQAEQNLPVAMPTAGLSQIAKGIGGIGGVGIKTSGTNGKGASAEKKAVKDGDRVKKIG